MVGVTGSIPVAPTIHSGFSLTDRDSRHVPANGGLSRKVFKTDFNNGRRRRRWQHGLRRLASERNTGWLSGGAGDFSGRLFFQAWYLLSEVLKS